LLARIALVAAVAGSLDAKRGGAGMLNGLARKRRRRERRRAKDRIRESG